LQPRIKTPYTVKEGDKIIEDTVVNLTGQRFMCSELSDDMTLDLTSGDPPSIEFLYYYYEWKVLEVLADIILFYRPYCVVEIGCGLSTFWLAKASEKAGVKFHSCDKSPRKRPLRYHMQHYHYQLMSEDFIKQFDDTPALVLIDGEHSYDTAKMEFEFFFDKLVPGGVIFLHDTYPPDEKFLEDWSCGDVYKLRQEY
jgi:hypothetical protein